MPQAVHIPSPQLLHHYMPCLNAHLPFPQPFHFATSQPRPPIDASTALHCITPQCVPSITMRILLCGVASHHAVSHHINKIVPCLNPHLTYPYASLLLLFSWPPVREVCPDYEVVMFQPRTGTPLDLGPVANCCVDIILIPALPFSALHPMSLRGG